MSSLAATEWAAIGTTARVVVTVPGHIEAAKRIVVEELATLDLACSRFRPDSEVSGLAGCGGMWAGVSAVLADILSCALEVARLTDGDVDPTMGTDLSRLGYDRDFGEILRVGTAGSGIAALPLTYRLVHRASWRDIELDRARNKVRVPTGVVLDLGATAKAWCADRSAQRVATELGVGVLVSLGGDIATAGSGPDGGWLVRVQDLPAVISGPSKTIALREGFAVATSSTLTRSWQRGTSKLHHILDPSTRRPAETVWRTVSVAADSCVQANAATTASIVRGQSAPRWLAGLDVAARLVDARGAVRTVGSWPQEVAA
jgi:FAD:protein FMN transferase